MKFTDVCLAGLLLGATAFSEESKGHTELPEGIEILSFEFRPTYKKGEESKIWLLDDAGIQPETVRNSPQQERGGFEVFLLLKNSSSRGIKRVDWDFFFVDGQTGRELKHQFWDRN